MRTWGQHAALSGSGDFLRDDADLRHSLIVLEHETTTLGRVIQLWNASLTQTSVAEGRARTFRRFAPSRPLCGGKCRRGQRGNLASVVFPHGDRQFESCSLQRGVRNEPSPEVMLVSPIFRDLPILLGRVRIPVRHPQPAKSQAGPEGNAEDPRNHTSSPVWRDSL